MAKKEDNSQFAPGVFLKRQTFGKGKGEIIKQNFVWDEFKAWAEQNVTSSGYLNVDIKTSKNDPNRLYMEINTWAPEKAETEDLPDVEDPEDDSEEDAPF